MKKPSLLLTALLVTAGTALGQAGTDDANINVTALVDAAISINVISDVQFGDLAGTAEDYYLNAGSGDGTVNDNLGTGFQVGEFEVEGLNERSFELEATNATLAEQTDDANTLLFEPTIVDEDETLIYNIGVQQAAAENIEFPSGAGLQTISFTIGGQLEGTEIPGVYSTEYDGGSPTTITVTYTDL